MSPRHDPATHPGHHHNDDREHPVTDETPPQNLDAERMTGNTDIDWLRSTTKVTVQHTKKNPLGETEVVHTAYFGVKPKSVPPVPREYSKIRFWPLFMTVTWINGTLHRVDMSGKQALKSGEIGVADHDRRFGRWSDEVNRDRMPKLVRDSIESYEAKVPVGSASPMVVE